MQSFKGCDACALSVLRTSKLARNQDYVGTHVLLNINNCLYCTLVCTSIWDATLYISCTTVQAGRCNMTLDWVISPKLEQARRSALVMNRKTSGKRQEKYFPTVCSFPTKAFIFFIPSSFHPTFFLAQPSPTCRVYWMSRDCRNSDKCKLGHDFLQVCFLLPPLNDLYNTIVRVTEFSLGFHLSWVVGAWYHRSCVLLFQNFFPICKTFLFCRSCWMK